MTIAGNNAVNEGQLYTLNLTATDLGNDTVQRWEFDWNGDNVFEQTVSGNPSSVTHTYPDGPAAFTIQARAVNEDGTFAANSKTVQVNNVAAITLIGNASVAEGAIFTLTLGAGVVEDPAVDTITHVEIDWGDETFQIFTAAQIAAANQQLTHVYADGPSTHTVRVFVRDEDGRHLGPTVDGQPMGVGHRANGQPFVIAVTNAALTASLQLAKTGRSAKGISSPFDSPPSPTHRWPMRPPGSSTASM